MGAVSWDAHNDLKRKNEKQKEMIDDLYNKNQELRDLYEKKEKEIQKQNELREKEIKEMQNRKILAIENLNKSLEKEQEEELLTIEKEMETMGENWCEDEIKDIDFDKLIKDCYDKLFKYENSNAIVKENVKKLIKELLKENEINHLNLEIIGKTGVGKSTLINTIFGENLADVKKGEPCTMETKCYSNKNYDFLRIYDTRGIEISKDFDIEKVFNETLEDIKLKCEKNEPENLIHCLLYCFTGTRFEKEEGEILVKLRQTYEGKKLPIIIVLTQDLGEEDDDETDKNGKGQLNKAIDKILDEKCEEHLSDKPKGISFIKILAKEKKIGKNYIIPPNGLDNLIEKCFLKGEYSTKYAIISSIKLSAEKKIKEDYLRIKNEILKEKEGFLNTLFQKNKEEEIFKDIIEKIFKIFSFLNNNELITEYSLDMMKKTNNKIIKLIIEKEDKIFRDYIEEKANYIASILIDKQTIIVKNYDFGCGDKMKDISEFSYKILYLLKSKFKKISRLNAIKNAARLISNYIIDIFMKCFLQSYLEELKSDENKKYLENSVKNCFSLELKNRIKGLINDLKLYQEKKSSPKHH